MILRKLRSRAGASLMAALFLFLLCAMAGSTILAAATANAGRLANRRVENQAYYKTISAARVFAKGFEGKQVQITLERTLDLDGIMTDYEWNIQAVKLDSDGVTYIPDTDSFSKFLEDSVKGIYGASVADQVQFDNYWRNDFSAAQEKSAVKKFTVELNGGAFSGLETAKKDALKVYGRIALQSLNGKIRAVFSSEDFLPPAVGATEETVKKGAYLIRLDCEPEVKTSAIVSEELLTGSGESVSVTGTEQTKTITFTWPNDIKIKEG